MRYPKSRIWNPRQLLWGGEFFGIVGKTYLPEIADTYIEYDEKDTELDCVENKGK
jgi:hypothetical protein